MGQALTIEHLSRRTVAMPECSRRIAVRRREAMVQVGTIFHRQVSLTARPSITYCVSPRSFSSLERPAVNTFPGDSTRLLVS
jgi:hypothetical protein